MEPIGYRHFRLVNIRHWMAIAPLQGGANAKIIRTPAVGADDDIPFNNRCRTAEARVPALPRHGGHVERAAPGLRGRRARYLSGLWRGRRPSRGKARRERRRRERATCGRGDAALRAARREWSSGLAAVIARAGTRRSDVFPRPLVSLLPVEHARGDPVRGPD